MRKIFAIIILLCGIAGDSWAVCELTEVTGNVNRNEYLFVNDPKTDKTALICGAGHCESGEIVVASFGHYWAKAKIDKISYYQCKKNKRWEFLGDENYLKKTGIELEKCPDDLGGRREISVRDIGIVFGKWHAERFVTDFCVKPYDEKCGVKCTSLDRKSVV